MAEKSKAGVQQVFVTTDSDVPVWVGWVPHDIVCHLRLTVMSNN